MTENKLDPVSEWIAKQQSSSVEIDISIIIPAYNEQYRIPSTIIDIIDYFKTRSEQYEIIVVDDGSKDDTIGVVQKFVKIDNRVQLLRLARNFGKGHAVKTGMLNARGKIVLFTDADGSTPIKELELLEEKLANGADLAIGSRAMASDSTRVKSRWYRRFLGRSFNYLVNILLLPGIADTQCGFKLFSAKSTRFLFERQTCDGFAFDLELLYLAKKAGLIVAEVPINWTHVHGSKVNLIVDSSKMALNIFIFRWRHRAVGRADWVKN